MFGGVVTMNIEVKHSKVCNTAADCESLKTVSYRRGVDETNTL